MDSDCLVKLTKAGAKEAIVSAMEVHIPPLVKKETVDEAKERGYQDAFINEENIDKKVLQVVKHQREKAPQKARWRSFRSILEATMRLLPATITGF